MDERQGVGVFLASKGCPYNCTYCSNHLLRKIYGKTGNAVRFRSVENVICEIEQVLSDYPFIHTIIFHDDILFLNRTWAETFAEKYPQKIGLPFICNARADVTDRHRVALLKKAGCTHVKFGLESGNETIRSEVLNRQMSNEQIQNAFSLCRQAGMATISFNMVGIPFETPLQVLDTIKLNAAIGVDMMQATIYQPYKGTRLAERCIEHNFIRSEDLGVSFFSPSVLKLDTLSPSQILMFKRYFTPLARVYGTLQRLPAALSSKTAAALDGLLSSKTTARFLNGFYRPLLRLKRFLVSLKERITSGPATGHPRTGTIDTPAGKGRGC